MPLTETTTPIVCTRDPLSSVDTDLVAVPWFEDEDAAAVPGLDAATGGDLSRALGSREFQGKPFESYVTTIVERAWKPRRVMLVGAGKRRMRSAAQTPPWRGAASWGSAPTSRASSRTSRATR